MAKVKRTTIERLNKIDIENIPKEGLERERMVKIRLNQSIFRTVILATYNYQCCITGITNTELIVASHIMPWSKDEKNRLNPMNGLALNALHDKAFENGLLAIDEDYKIVISSKLKSTNVDAITQLFTGYQGKSIILPDKFLPSKEFLKVRYDKFKV